MKIIGERLRGLRESVRLSQAKLAKEFDVSQSALARYEIDDSTPSPEVFLKYADYFDVSLDYIFGRTDDPHGMIYNNCVKLGLNNPEMARFVEMCFDPGSAMNERLKATLRYMDDFVLIYPDKRYLKECLKCIAAFLADTGLELNKKTSLYPLTQGVKMQNWRFVLTSDTGRVIRYMNNKKLGKQRRKMRKLMTREQAGRLAKGTTKDSLTAWIANAKRGDTFYQRQRMNRYYCQIEGGIENEQRTENGSND